MTQLKRNKDIVGRAHSKWIKENPNATLADLRRCLQAVYDEFLEYGEDDDIAEHFDSLGAAAEYLLEWGDLAAATDDFKATFGYREADLEGDISNVEELMELVGESFQVRRLRPRKKSA